jgi:hypothetical protein
VRRAGLLVPFLALMAAASLLGAISSVTPTPGEGWPRKSCGMPLVAGFAGSPNPYLDEGLLPGFDVPPPQSEVPALIENFRDSCIRRSRVRVVAAVVWAAGFAGAAVVLAMRRLRADSPATAQ